MGVFFAPTFMLAGKNTWDYPNDPIYPGDSQKWKFEPFTPAFGLFGEFAPIDHLALGLEAFFAFPSIDEAEDWEAGTGVMLSCTNCARDFFFSLLLRAKAPFRIRGIVAPYPIIGFGFDLYRLRPTNYKDSSYPGLTVQAGAGVEFYPLPFITPFIDIRYRFALGWHDWTNAYAVDVSEKVYTHGLVIEIGARFL